MIVNSRDNLAYDYRGSAQPQHLRPLKPLKKPKVTPPAKPPEQQRKKAKKAKPALKKNQKTAMILMTLITVAVFALVITRFAGISKLNNDITSIKQQLTEQQNLESRLRLELIANQSLDVIRNKASQALGMDFPDDEQIYYYNADGNNIASSGATP